MTNPKWRRVVFKISGAALLGSGSQSIDPKVILTYAARYLDVLTLPFDFSPVHFVATGKRKKCVGFVPFRVGGLYAKANRLIVYSWHLYILEPKI